MDYNTRMEIPITRFTVRNRVRELRNQRGLSQVELARIVGCSPTTVNHVETKAGKKPREVVMARLALALGVTVGDLFYMETTDAA